jgi:hypothetical protein
MNEYCIHLDLLSDTIFGSGEGLAGLVDVEVQHDEFGFPVLNGRTLRGLLVEECANLLYALKNHRLYAELQNSAQRLFGAPGSGFKEQSALSISDACLPAGLRQAATDLLENDPDKLSRQEILEAFTTIRRQTSVNPLTGAPKDTSLRAMRMILRETSFEAQVSFQQPPGKLDLPLLAACTLALRRAGLGRNRGNGELKASLWDAGGRDITQTQFDILKQELVRD